MMLQLNPSIMVKTPDGMGEAKFMIDYGEDSILYFVVFLEESLKIKTYAQDQLERTFSDDFEDVQDARLKVPNALLCE